MENRKIQGGVILIGSLLWETKELNPFGEAEKKLAEKRSEWRAKCLDKKSKTLNTLPIRYGRCSNSRGCTYTMVFSRSCLNINNGTAAIIPFKENIIFDDYENFKEMAFELASVEGISTSNIKLRKSWGSIALYINPKGNYIEKIKIMWENLKKIDQDYLAKKCQNFKINDNHENSTLLNDDYTLSSDVNIETELDFLFLTYIKPTHRDSTINEYPSPTDIATEIKRSGYDIYFTQNLANGISTFQDKEILRLLES